MKNDFWPGYGIGIIAGIFMTVIALSPWKNSNSEALDNCAKTHNVYQCEMVAVPKAGEK